MLASTLCPLRRQNRCLAIMPRCDLTADSTSYLLISQFVTLLLYSNLRSIMCLLIIIALRARLSFGAQHHAFFIQQETLHRVCVCTPNFATALLAELSGIVTDDIAMRLAHSAAAHSLIQQSDRHIAAAFLLASAWWWQDLKMVSESLTAEWLSATDDNRYLSPETQGLSSEA